MKEQRSTISGVLKILRFAGRYWFLITLTVLTMGAYAAVEVYYLILMSPFIDAFKDLMDSKDVAASIDADKLYTIGIKALILAPVIGLLALGKEIFSGRVRWGLLRDIRNAICTALLPQSLSFFEDRRSGDLLSRITNDVMRARLVFQQMFEGIPQQLWHAIVGTAVVIYYGRELVLGGLIIVPLIVIPVTFLATKIRRYGKQSLESLSDLTDLMTQMFGGIRVIKAFKMEDAEAQEFQRVNGRFFQKMVKIVTMKGLSAGTLEFVIRVFIGFSVIAVVWLKVAKGWPMKASSIFITIGGAYYAFHAMRKLVKSYNGLQEAIPGADRIIDLIEHPVTMEDAPDAQPLAHIEKSIAFRDVTFAYSGEAVLKNISLEISPGERVAIIGKSGSGKSTLVALIMRFYDVTQGSVEFDGVDVRQVTRDSLLDRIAIVSQQTFLFNRTIAENIRYGKRDATDEEVEAAARTANIHDFIVSLPEGYESLCGEFGGKLSGGQCQRIAIARTILKDADILILDEAMVGLDSESEALVRDALESLMEGRTTFIITHELATIRNADRILVLRDGELIAQGKHDGLMKDCAEYQMLYGLQP